MNEQQRVGLALDDYEGPGLADTPELERTDALDPDARARAVEIGDAIQRAVSQRPDIAVSIVGIGLDALSTGLRNSPDSILEMAPWLNLASDVFTYVIDGETTPKLDLLLAGDLGI